MRVRPCFLVVDHEYASSISTRKLVIETAKMNVITAYSAAEALASLERFPNVDGVVIDAGIEDVQGVKLADRIKQAHPSMPIVVVVRPNVAEDSSADFQVESFEPGKLLSLLQSLKPRETAEIKMHDHELGPKG